MSYRWHSAVVLAYQPKRSCNFGLQPLRVRLRVAKGVYQVKTVVSKSTEELITNLFYSVNKFSYPRAETKPRNDSGNCYRADDIRMHAYYLARSDLSKNC